MKKKQSKPNETVTEASTDDSMDKIRELLFGQQIRAIDQHIATSTSLLDRKIVEMREELQVKLNAHETAYNNAHKSLDKQRKSGDDELSKLFIKLRGDFDSTSKSLDERLAKIEQSIDEDLHSLRRTIEQRIDDLDTLQSHQHNQITKTINKISEQIEQDQISREDLAKLFSDVADKLRKK